MGSKIKTGRLPPQQQAERLDHGFYPESGRLCRQSRAIAPEQRRKPAAIEVGQQIQQATFAAADPVFTVVNQQNRGCVHPLAPFGGTAGKRVASRCSSAVAFASMAACCTYLMAATASANSR
ncbi:hypothetical protein D3C73_1072060 [compost metagenome]